ncbi:HK97 family phage prohead protease [Gryllotalpicola koreensis]|uniref:Prohead serine protease domain-containing protein n=1 Tax=Gryllotalpicola koreensis TaxID=993086 RepID=A0ABP8A6P7_9MICO
MNRHQIERLHRLGLIGDVQYTAALAQIGGNGEAPRPRLNVRSAFAGRLAVDDSSRTISGTASVYGELIPSHYMVLEPGSLQTRQPLTRNKMLVDHDQRQPVGYAASIDEGTLEVTYAIPEGEDGDKALASAQAGLRDGLSVGFTATDYFIDEDYNIHVTAADWYETSLVAIPAVADAGVTSVAASVAAATNTQEETPVNRAQLAAALAAGTITQEQHDAALAALTAIGPAPEPAAPATPEQALAAGPDQQPAPRGNLHTRSRGHNFQSVVMAITDAARNMRLRSVEDFNLAIGEFTGDSDAADAFGQPEWQGEVMQLANVDQPYVTAIGAPGTMNALKSKGWSWDEEPDVVDADLSSLAEIDSNDPTTKAFESTGWAVAAVHRVARSFVDFADPEFTSSFLQARARQYAIKYNAKARAAVQAAATTVPAFAAGSDIVSVLKGIIKQPRSIGGKINRIFLDDTLWAELEDLPAGPSAELPLWLQNANIVLNIADASAESQGGLTITNESTLAAGTYNAFDNRVLTLKEKQLPGIQAVAVSVGGIDLGFYGYGRLDPFDPRAILKGSRAA